MPRTLGGGRSVAGVVAVPRLELYFLMMARPEVVFASDADYLYRGVN